MRWTLRWPQERSGRPRDEDVHGALERRLVELVGTELGGRLRAGRSRNDQIATLIRMYLRDAMRAVTDGLSEVVGAFTTKRVINSVLPCRDGPTCSTRSRCCSSHHLLAHAWPLLRNCDRIRDLDHRLAVSPYGSAALAGTSLGLIHTSLPANLDFETSVGQLD